MQPGGGVLDALAHAGNLMAAEVLHHDDMAGAQRGAQHLFQVGQEDLAVGGGLDGHDGQHAGVVESAQYGQHLPVPAGHGVVDTLPARGWRIQPGHLHAHAALVQVDQVFGRDLRGFSKMGLTAEVVLFAVALGGVKRLFSEPAPASSAHALGARCSRRCPPPQFTLQLMQHDVRASLHKPAHQPCIDNAGPATALLQRPRPTSGTQLQRMVFATKQ